MEFNKDLRFGVALEILAAGFHRDKALVVADEILERADNEQIALAAAKFFAFRYAYSNCTAEAAVEAVRDLRRVSSA